MDAPSVDLDAALEACASEPIRVPGSVQPHGVLLAASGPDLEVVVASANTGEVLGAPPDAVLGRTVTDVLGGQVGSAVVEALAGALDDAEPLVVELEVGGGARRADLVLHRSGGLVVLELEPVDPADHGGDDLSYRALHRPIRRLQDTSSVVALARVTAAEVRALTGFDRVMVYRFDAEWNGEVIAEERRPDMEAFLGLRYPASDIPAQARELYRTNWMRLIADVDAPPAALVPDRDPRTGAPLDLSGSVLRSVSPVHLQYLRNMGVAASMSISLIDGDRLWGLIACHHDTPRRPRYAVRSAAELLGRTASLLLGTKASTDDHELEVAVAEALAELVQEVGDAGHDLPDRLEAAPRTLLTLTDATGVALRLDNRVRTIGETPSPRQASAIARTLLGDADGDGGDLAVTDRLTAAHPGLAEVRDVASGVLGVRIAERDDRWILWFRPEELQTVEWGGDPHASTVETNPDGTPRLSPRTSFSRWTERVRLRSRAWREEHVAAAATLGRHLTDVVRRRAQREAASAATLQRALLLEHLPEVPGLSLAVRYLPAADEPVGGDWYDVLHLGADRVGVTLGDVAGHGVDVAGIMAQLRHGLRAYLVREASPAAALQGLNDLTYHLLPRELATVIVADFTPSTGRLRLANAGHLPPLVVPDDGRTPSFLEQGAGPALGLLPDVAYPEVELHLDPGETLLLFSDGLVERRGEPLDTSLARLRAVVGDAPAPVEELLDVLGRTVADQPDDDVTVLALRADLVAPPTP